MDSYIWSHTKDGRYTVKSGYWKAVNDNIHDDDPKPPLANAKNTIERAVMDTKELIENTVDRDSHPKDSHHQRSNNAKWETPPRGWVKCNYDSSHHEGDNLNVVRLINDNEEHPRLRHYFETIWRWRSMFTSVKFMFRHRKHNKCADMLARKPITCNNNGMLFHSCPTFLADTVTLILVINKAF
ncbi:hypothetical protein ARALYDRAFT_917562 [Arabidopsis lyrata subsp. lyrata]|uniref:RNase H type-1 domain-containing protein n=1 Tax=Arabidopsis lyrata subsp. lyrata TaxID=81972 RepID=D7MTG7_ARALL|nr:hypothetical protein ARALYDRAFT_917562 [Arabidopsis lyrata subsp. lyrata]